MFHVNRTLFLGILLLWNGIIFLNIYVNATIIETTATGAEKMFTSSLENLTPEQSRAYDDELAKRIIALKKLREEYRKNKFYEAREALEKERLGHFRRALQNHLWVSDPYSAVAQQAFKKGKKETFGPSDNEYGVFKVKNKDYYMWATKERDYDNDRKGGEIEVDDPLAGLTEEEKKDKLRYVCQKDRYNEPFRDPKIIQFLRGVYYNFLVRSRNTSISQIGMTYTMKEMLRGGHIRPKGGKLTDEDVYYYEHMQHMHTYVGLLERSPRLEYEDLFPKYLPVNMPAKYVDFYNKKITLSREDCMTVYRYSYDPSKINKENNPRKVRVTGESCYEISTYCYNTNPNWNYKLNKLFNNTYVENTYSVYGELVDSEALHAFYKKTGCIPHLTGMIISPNAPYVGFNPDAITYCRGHPWLVLIKCPFACRRYPLHSVMGNLLFLKYKNGTYTLRKKHRIYGQLQLGLGILRMERAFFGIYGKYDGKLKLTEVRFDRPFFSEMINNVYKVYFSKLLPRFFMNSLLNG